jgi:hypothetical protein
MGYDAVNAQRGHNKSPAITLRSPSAVYVFCIRPSAAGPKGLALARQGFGYCSVMLAEDQGR